ncbi:MAG: acetyl-CoA carboxylase, carboxyltransferase subunit beta [Peptostreptococcaceae bacterium]
MFKNLIRKKEYVTISKREFQQSTSKVNIPEGKWINCNKCRNILYKEDLEVNNYVCGGCGYHFNIDSNKRIEQVCDSFVELFKEVKPTNPLDFPGYDEKILENQEKTGLDDAVVTGCGLINSKKAALAFMDSRFLMGSMGCAVGEKITRLVEFATDEKLPLIIFTASGGARMQEGIFSLMQMAKVSQAIKRHSDNKLLYITVLTNPTTGGVTASFAMQGDIILAEPGVTIGFAGRRVIEGTIKQKLPDEFQTSEFLVEKGFVDKIVKRNEIKDTLSIILKLHGVIDYENTI